MKKVQLIDHLTEIVEISNHNFSTLNEMIEEQRLSFASFDKKLEQQQKEIEELKQDSQTHYDALGHQNARMNDLQSLTEYLLANLLESTKAITTFVQSTNARLNKLENK